VIPSRWGDLESIFGPRGACGGCWCMLWRLRRAEFERLKGAGARRALRDIVLAGEVPGILAYSDGVAVGWCAVGPRDRYPALERSRIMARVDGRAVWSITCLYVAPSARRRGVSEHLLRAAATFARSQGAEIVEGYPVDPESPRYPPAFANMGLARAFQSAGFKEVARRSPNRPIMRITFRPRVGEST
jgi:GNAT superfamily N-acetyltransferase